MEIVLFNFFLFFHKDVLAKKNRSENTLKDVCEESPKKISEFPNSEKLFLLENLFRVTFRERKIFLACNATGR